MITDDQIRKLAEEGHIPEALRDAALMDELAAAAQNLDAERQLARQLCERAAAKERK